VVPVLLLFGPDQESRDASREPVHYVINDLSALRESRGCGLKIGDGEPVLPAIVLGSSLTAVGVIRSLGRIGIPQYTVCPEGELAIKSRWYRPAPHVPGPLPSPENLAEYLERLPFERAVLIACTDQWAKSVAELPPALRGRYLTSISSLPIMDTMTDKWLFAEMLQRVGIPHPRTLRVGSMEEMLALPDSSYEGMFLKPLHSQEFSTRHGVKAFQIDSKRQALDIMSKLGGTSGFPILLQRYVPGSATDHYFIDGFVDRQRRISTLFARRRLRMFPPLFGNSTLMETVPLCQVAGAVASIERMWSALEYRGIFSAEFKYDKESGEFQILEVNARPWWFIEFATRCGVDVCEMAYRDAQDLPVSPVAGYPMGRRCVYLLNDLASFRQTDSTFGGLLRWWRSWRGAEHTVFCWDDPSPALLSLARSLARIVRGKQSK